MFLKEIKFIFSQVQENKDALQPSNPLVKKKRGKGRQLEAVSEVASAQTEAPYTDHTAMPVEVTTPEDNEVSTDNKIPELRDRCKMISTTAHLSPSRKSERRVFHPEDFFE